MHTNKSNYVHSTFLIQWMPTGKLCYVGLSILYVSVNCNEERFYAGIRYQICCGCVWCNVLVRTRDSGKTSRKPHRIAPLQANYHFYVETFDKRSSIKLWCSLYNRKSLQNFQKDTIKNDETSTFKIPYYCVTLIVFIKILTASSLISINFVTETYLQTCYVHLSTFRKCLNTCRSITTEKCVFEKYHIIYILVVWLYFIVYVDMYS